MNYLSKLVPIFILGLTLNTSVCADENYPARPITWIVGGAAGGPTDAVARTMGERMAKALGQSVVIENVGGAGGTIATAKAARAKPDGYTFLLGHVGYVAAAPSLYKKLDYDPTVDFDAVLRFPDIPGVVLVNPSSNFKSLADLIDYAKENPEQVNFGDAGVGSMSNLVAAMLASRSGINITAVPYKGNGPAMMDLLAGRIEAMIDTANTAIPQVRDGKLLALATTGLEPMSLFPGVPAVAQTLPGFEGTVWFGIYGPKGTPQHVIDKLNEAYKKVMDDAEFTQRLVSQGMQLLSDEKYSPASFQEFTAAEIDKYRTIVREANIQPQ